MGYEELAAKYITGVGGLLDCQQFENLWQPGRPGEPEMEAAVWVFWCLTHPSNVDDLAAIMEQAKHRALKEEP